MVDDERKAFFINLYNILIIHATVALGAPSNVAGRLKFFPGACYEVGGSVYSADDIEHGVLRCNRATPSSLVRAHARISSEDTASMGIPDEGPELSLPLPPSTSLPRSSHPMAPLALALV